MNSAAATVVTIRKSRLRLALVRTRTVAPALRPLTVVILSAPAVSSAADTRSQPMLYSPPTGDQGKQQRKSGDSRRAKPLAQQLFDVARPNQASAPGWSVFRDIIQQLRRTSFKMA